MEMVDKFDARRTPLNKVTERYDRIVGEYRQSVHLWFRNSKGEFLIQQRSFTKKVFPGVWSITGGAVDAGESPLEAVKRECKEELGINLEEEKLALALSYRREFDFVDVYWTEQEIDLKSITMDPAEVIGVKFATADEIKELAEKKEFSHSIMMYFDTLVNMYEYYIKDGGVIFDKDGNLRQKL